MDEFYAFYNWYLRYFRSKDEETATIYDKFMALSYAVRTHIVENWIATQRRYKNGNVRRIYYVSLDYSFGRSLNRNVIDTEMTETVNSITKDLNTTLDLLSECEPEFELGNTPKGSMAHCIQETLASQGIAAMGYGLWYDYAQFRQEIQNGMQVEVPNIWKQGNHPWSVNRPEYEFEVGFGGYVTVEDRRYCWKPEERVRATPWDYPVVGCGNGVVNTARFWEALPVEEFAPDYTNHGDYTRACEDKTDSTSMTRYLFPDGVIKQTTTVRIKQQYFLAAASIQDIIRRYKASNGSIEDIASKVVVHLSDSKSTIMTLEMLRTLQYDEGLSFEKAFDIVREIFVFSTSGLTYDEFEVWPVYLVEEVLPLHVKMVFDMNQKLLEEARVNHNLTDEQLRTISLIEEGAVKKIRLAYVAAYISNFVTGVSGAQTTILKEKLFPYFEQVFGTKFISGATGISIRRWLLVGNQPLTKLISDSIGSHWINNNQELIKFYNYIEDAEVQNRFIAIKKEAKIRVSERLKNLLPLAIAENSLLILQSRKVHPSRRQTLQVLYIVDRYLRLKAGETLIPRTYLFGGYAAPTDFLGKQLIHLINIIATKINSDTATNGLLQVAFIPNCSSTMEELIAPAIDLVEHPTSIDGAALGTDILKFVVNGAVPLVGQNAPDIEMKELLGQDGVFCFDENPSVNYHPHDHLEAHKDLKTVVEFIEELIGRTELGQEVFPLLSSLRYNDDYRALEVFDEYKKVQSEVDELYVKQQEWVLRTLRNISHSGIGSFDGVIGNFYSKTGIF